MLMQDICTIKLRKTFSIFYNFVSIELVSIYDDAYHRIFFHGSEYMGLPLSETIFYSYFH
jgi:hypothetical protein